MGLDLDAIEARRREMMRTKNVVRLPPIREMMELSADVIAVVAEIQRVYEAARELRQVLGSNSIRMSKPPEMSNEQRAAQVADFAAYFRRRADVLDRTSWLEPTEGSHAAST